MSNMNDKDEFVAFWIESSDNDFKTMQDLHKTGNNNWALFIGHLVIEKLAKALFVKEMNDYPPFIHDLRRILEKAGIEIDNDRKVILDSISRFNIRARYDDFKQNFYSLCTNEFTDEWIEKIKESRIWIKSML